MDKKKPTDSWYCGKNYQYRITIEFTCSCKKFKKDYDCPHIKEAKDNINGNGEGYA